MKRRTFISMMSVMAAAGVLTLSGCSNSSTSTAAGSGASSAAGSAADQLAAIQASGKLIVALEGAWQPWSYHDESDTLVGYDVEVSRAIAEKLGVEPEYVESDWDSLFAGLDAGRFDIVCNGVEVTDERAKTYDFTVPYGYIHTALAVRKDNEDIKSFVGTPAKLANPGYGPAALEHYHRLGVKFDCIYSGYLADAAQAKLVEQAFELWPRAFKVVDPVLGDGGRLYSGLGADMVPAMYSLCSKADLIVPNVTEAALLLGDPLPGVGSAEQAAAQAARLTRVAPQVVVTGVTGIGGGRYIGCVGAARGGEGYAVKTPLQPRMFHGTGDIFAAVLVGRILRGNVPQAAVQAAAAFVAECIRQTPEGADERLGVWLENALPKLRQE